MPLFVERVARHTNQQAAGLHGVDVDELITLAVPQAMLGALRIARTLGQGTIGLGGGSAGGATRLCLLVAFFFLEFFFLEFFFLR